MIIVKNILVTCLVLNILSSTLLYPLVYLDFEMRRAYIAEVLCIQKDKPITVCGGKCYLENRLKLVSDFEQQEEKNAVQLPEINFINSFMTIWRAENRPIVLQEIQLSMLVKQLIGSFFLMDVFRPPQ